MTSHVIASSQINKLSKIVDLLIVTATKVESEMLHASLRPMPSEKEIYKVYEKSHTFYVGMYGAYPVVHVQCAMGGIGRDSSITTVIDAIDIWGAKALVMVGIAFGVNPDSQKIADVLVSESVLPYDSRKVGKDSTVYRGPSPQSGKTLVNRFRNVSGWEMPTDNGDAKIYVAPILSGEVLVDNEAFRNELCAEFPTAQGGEMEGAGVYAAAESRGIEWIIVKGICDFADGNKSANKEKFQRIAAKSAVSLCLHMLSSAHVLEALGVNAEARECSSRGMIDPELASTALFTVYTPEKEPFYLKRNIDGEIMDIFRNYGAWISGPCGCGKTNFILRNLYQANQTFIFLDLSVAVGKKGEAFLELLCSIIEETLDYHGLTSGRLGRNPQNLIEKICSLLTEGIGNKNIVLYLDEIPIDVIDEFEDFIEKMLAVQIRLVNIDPNSNIRFIFSTIVEPKRLVKPHQQKVYEKIKFIKLSHWEVSDLEALLDLLSRGMGLDVDELTKSSILSSGNSTPRYIKMLLKNYMMLPNWPLDRVIAETQKEVC